VNHRRCAPVVTGGGFRLHRQGRFVSGGDCGELREPVARGCRPPAEKSQRPRSRSR